MLYDCMIVISMTEIWAALWFLVILLSMWGWFWVNLLVICLMLLYWNYCRVFTILIFLRAVNLICFLFLVLSILPASFTLWFPCILLWVVGAGSICRKPRSSWNLRCSFYLYHSISRIRSSLIGFRKLLLLNGCAPIVCRCFIVWKVNP